MLLGLLSDTHLAEPDDRLEALLRGPLGPAEVLLHAGDHTGPAVVDYLEFVEPRPYHGVLGNMDGPGLGGRLPPTRVLELGGCRVGLVHGWGPPAGLAERVAQVFRNEGVQLVVFGHSHAAEDRTIGGVRFVNPGSAFDRRWAPRRTVALVEVGPGGVGRVEFVEVPE
ncbi:metallophosphoesterase family protein [Deferrisoma palaeochoriense]